MFLRSLCKLYWLFIFTLKSQTTLHPQVLVRLGVCIQSFTSLLSVQQIFKSPQCFYGNRKMAVNFKMHNGICIPDELLCIWLGVCFSHLHCKVLIASDLAKCSDLDQAGSDILHRPYAVKGFTGKLCPGRSTCKDTDTFPPTNFTDSWDSQLQSSSLGEISSPVQRLLGDLLLFLLEILGGQLASCSLIAHCSQPEGMCSEGEMVHLCPVRE